MGSGNIPGYEKLELKPTDDELSGSEKMGFGKMQDAPIDRGLWSEAPSTVSITAEEMAENAKPDALEKLAIEKMKAFEITDDGHDHYIQVGSNTTTTASNSGIKMYDDTFTHKEVSVPLKIDSNYFSNIMNVKLEHTLEKACISTKLSRTYSELLSLTMDKYSTALSAKIFDQTVHDWGYIHRSMGVSMDGGENHTSEETYDNQRLK